LVEFALVLPIFALMLLAMMWFGITFAGWDQLRNQVQVAARQVAISCSTTTTGPPTTGTTGCDDAIAGEISPPLATTKTPVVNVYYYSTSDPDHSSSAPDEVFVCAQADIGFSLPLVGNLTIPLRSTSAFYIVPTAPPSTYNTAVPPGCGVPAQ
jgi:Flp pilus assembly protein TadG